MNLKFSPLLLTLIITITQVNIFSTPATDSLPPDSILSRQLKMIENVIPLRNHPLLRKWIYIYTHKTAFRKWLEKAFANLCVMEEIIDYYLQLYNMPPELKYLVIVESAAKLHATSRSGAVGPWQFIRGTARLYGLRVDVWIDERKDLFLSTKKALEYLRDLHQQFNDWHLALASYNAGPARVRWAIKRAKRAGYENPDSFEILLRYLPVETRNYVYRFMAIYYLAVFGKEYGLNWDTVRPDYPHISPYNIDTVHVKGPVSLAQVAYVLGIDPDTIIFLNASWRMGRLPAGKHYFVRLPCKQAELVKGILVNVNWAQIKVPEKFYAEFEEKLPRAVYHIVRKGETLSHIARRYGVTVAQLRAWNGIRGHLIYPGQRIVIYIKPPRS